MLSTSSSICSRTVFIFASSARMSSRCWSRQLQAHQRDGVIGPQLVQQLLGSARLEPTMGATRSELGQQPMEPTHGLGAQGAELVAAVGQQPQADQVPSARTATTPLLFSAASPIETASSTSVLRPWPWE